MSVSHRVTVERIESAMAGIDPTFLGSPQYECAPLSEALGTRVVLKVETLNPIRSFKGRGADWLVAQDACGDGATPIVCASAGNFGQGMAYACARRGRDLTVFAAEGASPMKLRRMRGLGADVRVEGRDFDAAKVAARAYAAQRGARFAEDGFDVATGEGAGTIAVELLRYKEPLDVVIAPLGNGALLAGIGRWTKAQRADLAVWGASATGAPAMEESMGNGLGGRIVESGSVDTIADSVAVRVPIPECVEELHGIVDDVVAVPDQLTIEAMQWAYRHIGLMLEPAGALAIAAVLARRDSLAGKRVGLVLTGSNIEPEPFHALLRKW